MLPWIQEVVGVLSWNALSYILHNFGILLTLHIPFEGQWRLACVSSQLQECRTFGSFIVNLNLPWEAQEGLTVISGSSVASLQEWEGLDMWLYVNKKPVGLLFMGQWKLPQQKCQCHKSDIQWNLCIQDTLGPA